MLHLLVALTTVAALAAGCSSSDSPPPAKAASTPSAGDSIHAVPFASTAMLSAADLASLKPDTGDGSLVFATAPAALADVRRGSILVAGQTPATPHGLLRVVRTVQREGEGLTLQTANAPIQLAFRSLDLHVATRSTGDLAKVLSTPPRGSTGTTSGALATGTASKTVSKQVVLFDGDGDAETEDDRVVLDVDLGGSVDYGLSLAFDWGAIDKLPDLVESCIVGWLDVLDGGDPPDCSFDALLPEAKASYDVTGHLTTSAKLAGAAKAEFVKTFPIFPPETLAEIPIGPVVVAPVLQIDGTVEGGASAQFSLGVHAQGDIATGVDVSSKHLGQPTLRLPKVENVKFQPDAPTASLGAHAKASVSASVTTTLFNVAGPYASLGLAAEISASTDSHPCWTAHAGIESDIGLRVVPSLPLIGSVTLFEWSAAPFEGADIDLAHGDCLDDPDASTLPPGSGADGKHYAHPTFVPWSFAYASPADSSAVLLPTADASDWTDLHPTLDGRYVVAGTGAQTLFKIAESGAVVWARHYPVEGDPGLPDVVRVANTADAGLLVATRTGGTPGIGLMKVSQSGEVLWHQKVVLGDALSCDPDTQAMTPTGDGRTWVAGGCADGGKGWLLRVDPQGKVSDLWTFADPAGSPLGITVLVGIQGEAVVAGSVTPATGQGDRMFAVRFQPTGTPRFARWYAGCATTPDLSPTAGIAGANGDVTLAGSSAGHHDTFLARLKQDGSVGWQAFPNIGNSLARVVVINSLVELPTTGYVAGGTTVDVTAEGADNTPSVALAGFDGAGGVLWSQRYTLKSAVAGAFLASAFAGVQLTDDGGALVAALAQGDAGVPGQVWAMKVFAKNGEIALDPGKAVRADLGLQDLDCSLDATAWSPVLGSGAFQVTPLATTAVPTDLQRSSQAQAGVPVQ